MAVSLLGVGLAMPASAQAPAQFHGAAVQKACPPLSKVGDTRTCTIRFRNQDDFGDSHTLSEAWDVVDPGGLNIRVPAAGNLPITAVSPTVTCAAAPAGPAAPIGLTFPCTIPGAAQDGGSNLFVEVRASFVIPEGVPDPLPDQGTTRSNDNCDAPGTSGCSTTVNTLQQPAAINLFQPSIEVTKTGPAIAKVGDTLNYSVSFANTSSADTPALTCTASDSLAGDLGAISAGQTINYQRQVQAGDPDPLINTATVTCSIAGFPNQVSDSDQVSTDLVHPGVSLTKECRPDPVSVGADITWAITVENTGDVALDCLVDDATAGFVDEPLSLAGGASDSLNASRATTEADVPSISNTASVSCTLSGVNLPNVVGDEDTADCEVVPVGDEICRTPGFWGTHAGIEKKNSNNLTQMVIDAAGGSLSICGTTIDNTNVGNAFSAVEAMCVSVQGEQQRQLARQLTAMALNCVVSGGGSDCSGTSVEELFADADAACAANSEDLSGFIAGVDCFNNGGQFDSENGTCFIDDEDPNNCHNRELSESDVFEGVKPLPGPAGSSKACNAAIGNSTFVVP